MATIAGEDWPTDDDIVARIRAGDELIFARLLRAWSPGMLRAARAYVASPESAEDTVQDAWLAVLRGIDRFEGRSSLRTWVYRIVVNTAKTRGVKESRIQDSGPTVDPSRFRGPDDRFPGHWTEFPAAWPSVEHEIEGSEMRRQIDAAVDVLPARQRIVITLRDIEGYDSEEVCAILGISLGNQRVLLHRARAAVRARLEVYFNAQLR